MIRLEIQIAMPRNKQFDTDEVLDKAMELFWKQGFHATTMQNLVDSLGINRASIYDTFGGKHQLYEAAFERYRERNQDQIKGLLDREKNAFKGLRKLFLWNLEVSLQDKDNKGCFVVNCTSEYYPLNKAISSTLLHNKAAFESAVSKFISLGQQKRQLSKNLDAEGMAQYLYTVYNGLKNVAQVNKDRKELERIVDTALQVLQTKKPG